ncbi:hypothetical protein MUO14_08285 [Halobacillus shinanisalinarum]|uniref:Uncharacterized protein n=1 Tax=Halobacillus shinanisalinarum TaxID=2932258 RepID=A0ABY4H4T0_9BACI|nr:hypothetical protein [Halobacillus shinanisalinarum]UOQ94910.1 hypothetical protein MUO14_08285 [Halobacillus shinanisalinarum]
MNIKESSSENKKETNVQLPSEKLGDMYRSQVSAAKRNSSPFGGKENREDELDYQGFKDAYKKEVMNFIEPMVGKGLDKEEGTDSQERLSQMLSFQRNHNHKEVNELKEESLQELKELPLTERGEQRLAQIEAKLEREVSPCKEKGEGKGKQMSERTKSNQDIYQQTDKKKKVEIER